MLYLGVYDCVFIYNYVYSFNMVDYIVSVVEIYLCFIFIECVIMVWNKVNLYFCFFYIDIGNWVLFKLIF